MAVIAGGRFQFSVGSGWGRDRGRTGSLEGRQGQEAAATSRHSRWCDGVTGPGGAGELVGSGQSRGAMCIGCSVAGGLHQQGDGLWVWGKEGRDARSLGLV